MCLAWLVQSTADRSHPTAVRMLSGDLDGAYPQPGASPPAASAGLQTAAHNVQLPACWPPAAAGGGGAAAASASMGTPNSAASPSVPQISLRGGGAGAPSEPDGEVQPAAEAAESQRKMSVAAPAALPSLAGPAATAGVAISPFAAFANARRRGAAGGLLPVVFVRQDSSASAPVADLDEHAGGAADGAAASDTEDLLARLSLASGARRSQDPAHPADAEQQADVLGAAARQAASGGELAQSGAFMAVGSYVAGLRRASQVSRCARS